MAEEVKNTQEAPEQSPAPAAETEKKGKKTKTPSGKEAKIAALEEKLAAAEKKTEETKDSLLRTAAEYDNFRKRSRTEHDAAFSNGVAHAVEQLLPVLDTLDAAAKAETADADYKKGVLLTLQKCEEIFKKLGITEIDAENQPFDPELHNACMQDPSGGESGICTKVVQKGYMLGGKVIRHAMVAVSP